MNTSIADRHTVSDQQAIEDLAELAQLVALSKRIPGKFDWKKNLNEWQVLFADYILAVSNAIKGEFIPTPKQAAKIKEVVARIKLI
jgi:hypothetical protein